jgi:allantoate deiminase
VVSAIAGQSRIGIAVSGAAGHAGTVPMEVRRDALCAAAEFVLVVEALGRSRAGIVATVGQLEVHPGASNVIPGHVTLSLDVRHPDDAAREAACRGLQEQASRICAQRQVALDWRVYQQSPAVTCDPGLSRALARAIEAQGYRVTYLASSAGHDGVASSVLTPIVMLFVRCQGGISHHPAESVSSEDVAVAIEVLSRFLTLLALPQAAM